MRVRGETKWCGALVALLVALCLGGAPHPLPAQSRAPRTALIIVNGVGGEPRLRDTFHGWSIAVAKAATQRFGLPDSLVIVLGEDSTRAGVAGRSTKDNILRTVVRLGASSREGDRLFLVLFGHGSSQGGDARFNVPGPDLSPEELRAVLAPFATLSIVVVNTASASGDFVKVLAGPNRTIITATRSGREQNETLFPAHFVAALTTDVADTDKDGRVNLLEAFTYARREVERVFEQGNRIATEHALLDDDGDGVGHGDASERGPDGLRARAIFLEPIGGTTVASDPRAAQLLAQRRDVEGRIEALRARRTTLGEAAYQEALEPLMVELARTTQALRALEEKKP